jgi:hypothetical protein
MAKATKERIFYPHKYYVVDKNNIVFASADSMDELKGKSYDSTDTILIAIPCPQISKTIDKIVLDFNKKTIKITGGDCTLAKVVYEGDQEYTLEDEELKEWETIVIDANKICKDVSIIGEPPVNGELLYV